MPDNEKKPQKRDTSAKRESILSAAVTVFLNEGYESASMDRIAETARASKRTVYNHFASKEELFQAVVGQFRTDMQNLKRRAYDPAQPVADQLGEFADAEISVVTNPTWMGVIKVLLAVFIRSPEMARQVMLQSGSADDALVEWMRAAAQDGKLSVNDPRMAATVFTSLMGGAFTWPAVYRGGLDPRLIPALKEEMIQTFLCRFGKSGE